MTAADAATRVEFKKFAIFELNLAKSTLNGAERCYNSAPYANTRTKVGLTNSY